MRILVISDTHQNYPALETILLRHPDADACIHLGDCEEETDLFRATHPEWQDRFFCIKGNCDYGSEKPIFLTLDLIPGHRIFATHGHYYDLYSGDDAILNAAKEQECDIILHGHTHIRRSQYIDGTYLINPGSAAQPRDELPPSYAFLDYEKGGILVNHVSL